MKKLICFLLLLVACLAIVSCGYKDTHVLRIDDYTLQFNGENYKLMSPEAPSYSILEANSDTVYVTEQAVPSLLSRIFREGWYSNTNTYMSKNEYFISQGLAVYCREDIYPEIEEMTEDDFDSYCYEYCNGSMESCYILTDEEMVAVDTVLSEVEPIASYDLGYLPVIKDVIYLEYLQTDTEIAKGKGSLYVLEDGYCFKEILEYGITAYIIVPDELVAHFDNMTEAYYS